jgi:hypothetical protein
LAAGEDHEQQKCAIAFYGGRQRGRHQATYCARPGTRVGVCVVSDESKRRLAGKSVWKGGL